MRLEMSMTYQSGYIPVAKILVYDLTSVEDANKVIAELQNVKRFLVRFQLPKETKK